MGNYITGLVSVVMPTYKRSEKLTRAINSVLNQTYRNIELLLVNDNDPNDEYSKDLIKRIGCYKNDERFIFITQEKHINGAVARNVALRQARGEFIAFLDDDDWWSAKKLEQQIIALKSLDDTWGGVSCKFILYDEKSNIIGRTAKYQDGLIYKDILFLQSDVATGTLLLKHELLDKTGYFDEKLLRHQDLQLLLQFSLTYKIMEVDEYLHNVDVSDTRNRPTPEKLMEYKKAFFKSVENVTNTLSKKEIKCVCAMHKYELGYVCLKNGYYLQGLKYISAIFSSPMALKYGLKKTYNKLKQSIKRRQIHERF